MEITNHHHRPKLLYPSMVIAAIAVTVFSLLGIATLTGALPFAHSETKGAMGETAAANADEDYVSPAKKLAAACASCGVVESVRAIEVKGQGSGVGAVAGGLTGALVGMGIPEFEAKKYEGKLRDGNVLISVHSENGDEVKRAKDIFEACKAHDISTAAEASVKGERKHVVREEEKAVKREDKALREGTTIVEETTVRREDRLRRDT